MTPSPTIHSIAHDSTGEPIGDRVITIVGDPILADTRALIIALNYVQYPYKLERINTLVGQHRSKEFISKYPSGYLPILIDGNCQIYGSVTIALAHICRKYSEAGEKLSFRKYAKQTDQLSALFEQRFRPVTTRLSRMMLVPHSTQRDSTKVSQQDLDSQLREVKLRVLPQLEKILDNRQFFCGDEITCLDIQIYCELSTVTELLGRGPLVDDTLPGLQKWMELLDLTASFKEERQGYSQ